MPGPRLPGAASWGRLPRPAGAGYLCATPGACSLQVQNTWARGLGLQRPGLAGPPVGAPQNGLPRPVLAVAARLWDLLLLLLCCFCFAFSEQGDLLGS